MPNLDELSSSYGRGGASGKGPGQGGASTGGKGGNQGGSGGSDSGGVGGVGGVGGAGGSSVGGVGGTGGSRGGESGAPEAGQSGEAGQAGAGAGGAGGTGGSQGGGGGKAGTSTGGKTSSGGKSAGGTSGGIAGEAGAAGAGPGLPCVDGCALLYVPPFANFSQFFTINVNLSAGVDLSDSILTAHLRTVDFAGTSETIQFYASALPNFNFYGNNNVTVALSTLANGGTLTMDLTSTGAWDHTKVISIGFLLHGAATASPVKVLVEDILIEPSVAPKAGPWLFTQQANVLETPAESVPSSYSDPNIIFANPYNPVPGTIATWVPPEGAGGSP